MQKKLEIVFWLSVTGQNQPAAVTSGKPHVDHLDVTEFFQDGLRCQTRSIRHSAILQCDLQTVRQKSEEDVGIDTIFLLVIDRTDIQFAFQLAEHRFDLSQLDVECPDKGRVFSAKI